VGRVELRKQDTGWPLEEYEALAREDEVRGRARARVRVRVRAWARARARA